MRYAIFTDIHANLEALDAVLEKIDALSKEKPIDHIWFLGDLVGYGPNPNECIDKLRKRTDVMIAGNHDWAAVGKIDLEDFSAAARISAEWTAEQLTDENKNFLANLPERIEMGECTLVHGSPYGPLWEYLTSEVLAERSFQHFSSRFCFVGHTHVPVIFQQPDAIANAPTLPLVEEVRNGTAHARSGNESTGEEHTGESEDTQDTEDTEDTDETAEMAVVQPPAHSNKLTITAESAYADPTSGKVMSEEEANSLLEAQKNVTAETQGIQHTGGTDENEIVEDDEQEAVTEILIDTSKQNDENETGEDDEDSENEDEDENEGTPQDAVVPDVMHDDEFSEQDTDGPEQGTTEEVVANAEDRLNSEIEELLTLLGLSESMIQVTNEMLQPPLGHWEAPIGYRAIINPGGVGQPRDGDPRAAFMIYDTEEGFEFYRIPYPFNKTQEKIIKAGLPQYLAVRLAYGR
jgi:diadenosine tetraphosphatase ApaH/serine/threonine PP2A family protein phosphatase